MELIKRNILFCMIWFFAFALFISVTDYAQAEPNQVSSPSRFTFGIVPQQSEASTIATWKPFLDFVSDKSRVPLQIKSVKSIPHFEDVLFQGGYDFAYMNPYHYIVFHEKVGYDAIAKAKDKKIRGILVVRKDSPITSLNELSGKKLAFPSHGAFAASILTRSYLKNNDIPFTPVYVNSHSSVYFSVMRKHYIAGGGVIRTLKSFPEKSRSYLRVLWSSNPYMPHAIAVHPRVPKEIIAQVVKTMSLMAKSNEGKSILKNLRIKGIQGARDADWDDVRALGISLRLGTKE